MLDHVLLSDALGYLSILCWLGAQFPQVIVNLRTKSVEGLALPFLANWLFGDITNLIGCILTHQLPFQTYLASYFVFVDLTLVAQYIYYYKTPLPPSPTSSVSPSPSRSASLAMTVTPTVAYSPRNLTLPSSRTPLLVGELEAGYRTYDVRARAASQPRSGTAGSMTNTRRFSGVLSSYPPAGLLPSADEIEGKGKERRAASKRSVSSLRRRVEKAAEERERSRDGNGDGEDEDELSAMTESFYSDVSAPDGGGAPTGGHLTGATGVRRHVSWSRAVSESALDDTPGENTPRQGIIPPRPLFHARNQASTSAMGITTPHAEPHLQHQQQLEEEARQRSRSRGRASRRNRPSPLLVYELASPGAGGPASASTALDSDGDALSAQEQHSTGLSHMDAIVKVAGERERDSKSGSRRRRSASIVFLSVGFGALLAFGGSAGGGISGMVQHTDARAQGRVLGLGLSLGDVASTSDWEDAYLYTGTVQSSPIVDMESTGPSNDESKMKHRRRARRRPHDAPPLTPEQKRRLVGRISAWACTTLYLTSRLPQIWKNYTRKSVQGLSLALFVFAFLGNTCYVASILSSPVLWEYPPVEEEPVGAAAAVSAMQSALEAEAFRPEPPYNSPRARAFLQESLPYLLGSGGTLCFDVIIVTQGIIYGRRERSLLEEEEEESDEEGDEEEESDADGEWSGGECTEDVVKRPLVVRAGSAPGPEGSTRVGGGGLNVDFDALGRRHV